MYGEFSFSSLSAASVAGAVVVVVIVILVSAFGRANLICFATKKEPG